MTPLDGRLDRRQFLRATLAATAGGAVLYAVGCGSSGSQGAATATGAAGGTPASTANPAGITPSLLTTEFVAHQDNRFAVGLLNGQGQLVKDAKVHLRFFTIGADGKTGAFRGEGDATYQELNMPGAHAHDKSAGAAVTDDTVSFYEVNTPFDQAGKWGVEITATPNDGSKPSQVRVPFEVLATLQSPGLGTVPPASHNDTFATNLDKASLCSRVPPCTLHDKVIADVLGKGRPLVVQFSTPAFCQTRFCGPVLEVLLSQVPQYRDRVGFVHIEVWQDFQLQKYRPAVQEWRLPGEPYTFFMGKDGKVVGRLEAIFTGQELTKALEGLVAL
ncbi:MAG: TlpA family protein disulfide reductase [Dehalococcoidia bacterium]